MKKQFKHIAVIGMGASALQAAKIIAEKQGVKLIAVDSKGGSVAENDFSQREIELMELKEALERFSEAGKKANKAGEDFAIELGKIGDRIGFDINKKIHPKHQKHNKYRFK